MRIIERFDLYMKYKGLNDNKVTKQLQLSNGTIGKSRKEGRELSDRVIELIEKFYTDLNPDWLRTGEGEMLQATKFYKDEEPLILSGAAKQLVLNLSSALNQQEANIAKLTEMVDRLTAGDGSMKKDNTG